MLPKIEQPYYNTILPVSGETVKYRPYLVKEEKIILIAMSGGAEDDMKSAIIQIISNCTDGLVNPVKMNSIDISFLMSKIRSASKGGIVEIGMRCKNDIGFNEGTEEEPNIVTKPCNHLNTIPVDLDQMGLTDVPKDIKDTVTISDTLGIKLKMPGIDILDIIQGENINIVDILPSVIEYIYDADSIYKLEDATKEEVSEFIESLNDEHLRQIDAYFSSIPKLKVDIKFQCEKCGHKESITIEDIQNFF